MPRMRDRILHPEFFTDAKLYDAEKSSGLPLRLAYEGLWCASDREGRFEWKPRELKLGILPYDQVDFAAVLQALVDFGFVTRYVVDSAEVGWVRKFHKWQHVHPKEARTKLPEPPSISVIAPEATEAVNVIQCNSQELNGIPVVSTSTSTSTSSDPPKNGKPRTTWLTPYCDRWTAGKPPVKQMAQVLGPRRKAVGDHETQKRFGRYLSGTPPKYWSLQRFDSTWELWGDEQYKSPDGITDEPNLEYID